MAFFYCAFLRGLVPRGPVPIEEVSMDFKILLEKITPILKRVARKHILRGFYDENDLYQEMCLYLWQNYSEGLPIGINESYVIKGCEFHILNHMRKGRSRFKSVSLDEPISEKGGTLKDMLEDKSPMSLSNTDTRLTIEDIRNKGLSVKEMKVLGLLIKGHTVREIAKILSVSHVMVLKYKKSIIKKANIKGYQT